MLGCALSGAGPGVLMVMAEGTNLSRAAAAIEANLADKDLDAEIISTAIENTGGIESYVEVEEFAKGARP